MIDKLKTTYDMQPHPEGGFFKETYRAESRITSSFGERSASTAIYFLITPGSVSRLHRIRADEVWHFYLGGPMTVVELVDGCGSSANFSATRDFFRGHYRRGAPAPFRGRGGETTVAIHGA